MVRCSGLERSRRSKMFYCNIRTPVHRIAIPKVMWLLYPKFWVQTFGIATLWTGVSVFCNLHTAFPLYLPLCVPRSRSDFYCHRSRFRSCYYDDPSLSFTKYMALLGFSTTEKPDLCKCLFKKRNFKYASRCSSSKLNWASHIVTKSHIIKLHFMATHNRVTGIVMSWRSFQQDRL